MERYEKELRGGRLNWGLLHTDKFWKENFMAFENKEFELIRYVSLRTELRFVPGG
jgi:V-type H+-transporting ATPase subunit H